MPLLLLAAIPMALAEEGVVMDHGNAAAPAVMETQEHPAAAEGEALIHDAAQAEGHAVEEHNAEGHGGEHKSGGLPQFNPASFPSQVFWLAITFAFLYTFFSRKTLPNIAAILSGRDGHIRSHLDRATQQKETAETLRQEYETEMKRAHEQALGAFTKAEQDMKAKADSRQKDFQKKSEETVEKLQDSIEKAKAGAMEDMHALAAEIASKAAEKIIGVETDIDQAKTVVRSIKAKAA